MRTALVILSLFLVNISAAFAQDSTSSQNTKPGDPGDQVCAAVLPCAEDGTVLENFREGYCGAIYARQCAALVANPKADGPESGDQSYQQLLEQELVSCEKQSSNIQVQLRRQIKQLRRQLRVR